jgi:hypothetical protein
MGATRADKLYLNKMTKGNTSSHGKFMNSIINWAAEGSTPMLSCRETVHALGESSEERVEAKKEDGRNALDFWALWMRRGRLESRALGGLRQLLMLRQRHVSMNNELALGTHFWRREISPSELDQNCLHSKFPLPLSQARKLSRIHLVISITLSCHSLTLWRMIESLPCQSSGRRRGC